MKRPLVAILLTGLATAALGAPSAGAQTSDPQLSPYKFVQLPGMRAGWRAAGSGRPLVLIPGYGLTAAEWDPDLVTRLAANRRVIVFDNRGVATSSGSVRRLSITQMANDTANLIRALRLGRPDVLGWSMGGYIAQELALRHPRSLRRLVLAGTRLALRIPGARLRLYPDAGHAFPVQDRARFAPLVERFLAARGP